MKLMSSLTCHLRFSISFQETLKYEWQCSQYLELNPNCVEAIKQIQLLCCYVIAVFTSRVRGQLPRCQTFNQGANFDFYHFDIYRPCLYPDHYVNYRSVKTGHVLPRGSLNFCLSIIWFLDLNDLVRINRAWLCKEPKVSVLQANTQSAQKGGCWSWNQSFMRNMGSILIGLTCFQWIFCFYVVMFLMQMQMAFLPMLCVCENPECKFNNFSLCSWLVSGWYMIMPHVEMEINYPSERRDCKRLLKTTSTEDQKYWKPDI